MLRRVEARSDLLQSIAIGHCNSREIENILAGSWDTLVDRRPYGIILIFVGAQTPTLKPAQCSDTIRLQIANYNRALLCKEMKALICPILNQICSFINNVICFGIS